MTDDEKPIIGQSVFRLIQITIFLAVVFAAIWFEDAYDYPINGYIKGAWGFMASYGFTLLWCRFEAFLILRRARLRSFAGQE